MEKVNKPAHRVNNKVYEIELKNVYIKIKNITGSEENEWLLWELAKAGVKSGHEVNGQYNSLSGAVKFSCGGADCVAWVNHTCEIIAAASEQ